MALDNYPTIMKPLFLASQSTQRALVLSQLGLYFEIIPVKILETTLIKADDSEIIRVVQENALKKAQSLLHLVTEGIIIAGDTLIVTHDQCVLGKPRTATEAYKMLQSLVGNWHRVISAVAMIDASTSKSLVRYLWTRVKFRSLAKDILRDYVSTKEPLGKAGGYAIQGKGAYFIERIEGSYTSVVGLPLELVIEMFDVFGIEPKHHWLR